MARIPTTHDRWYTVRIESGPGDVRFWLDDRLVAIKRNHDLTSGSIARLQLSPGTELLRADLTTLETRTHEMIPLGGYSNEVNFLDSQVKHEVLPLGETLKVGDVPFAMPHVNLEGKDHIDIGKSLFRHANQEGYFPTYEHTWIGPPGPARRDPARIQLRVPNARYEALYLLAAADGAANSVPLVTAMFYRPGAGFAENFEATVPLATADSSGATPYPVTLANGKKANLWLVKIPLDPGRLTAFADMDIVEIELTKKVHQFRSYPDPILYGWHQGGLPSGVHVFGVTLQEFAPPVRLPARALRPRLDRRRRCRRTSLASMPHLPEAKGSISVVTKSHDGTETLKATVPIDLKKGASRKGQAAVPRETQRLPRHRSHARCRRSKMGRKTVVRAAGAGHAGRALDGRQRRALRLLELSRRTPHAEGGASCRADDEGRGTHRASVCR